MQPLHGIHLQGRVLIPAPDGRCIFNLKTEKTAAKAAASNWLKKADRVFSSLILTGCIASYSKPKDILSSEEKTAKMPSKESNEALSCTFQ